MTIPNEAFGQTPSHLENPLDLWKASVRRDIEAWLAEVEEIPEPTDAEADEAGNPPDLAAFYGQLTAASAEWKRSGRRTADALAQLGEALNGLGEETRQLRAQRATAQEADALPRGWCISLVELHDRFHRITQAFSGEPPRGNSWLPGAKVAAAAWATAWRTQGQALEILASHVDALLKKAGVQRMATIGEAFDPTRMTAVAAEADVSRPDQTVIVELLPGYVRGAEVIRPAQVKVSRRP